MKKEKILLVDDQPTWSLVAKHILLKEPNFEVIAAEDGEKAVKLATSERPDLVVLDIRLPVMDGFDVLQELKKRNVETRVLMTSAVDVDISTAIRCIKLGACDFILKPWGHEIIEKIKRNILLENTLNMNVSNPLPFVEDVINKARVLAIENARLQVDNRKLMEKTFWNEAALKGFYIILCLLVTLTLHYLSVIRNPFILFTVPIIFFLFLLIPIDRIQRLSTKFLKFHTKIDLK
jgi:DNA-binding response OmpR family regulator